MAVDVVKLAQDIGKVLAEIGHDASKNSDGGKKITPSEWAQIGIKLGIVGVDVAEAVVAGQG